MTEESQYDAEQYDKVLQLPDSYINDFVSENMRKNEHGSAAPVTRAGSPTRTGTSPNKSPTQLIENTAKLISAIEESSQNATDQTLREKQITALINQAHYFEAQYYPLYIENHRLKDKLIQLNRRIEENARQLVRLTRAQTPQGEERDLLQQIGELEDVRQMVSEDIQEMQTTIARQDQTIKELQKQLTAKEQLIETQQSEHQIVLEKAKEQLLELNKTAIQELMQNNELAKKKQKETANQNAEYLQNIKNLEMEVDRVTRDAAGAAQEHHRTEIELRVQVQRLEKRCEEWRSRLEFEKRQLEQIYWQKVEQSAIEQAALNRRTQQAHDERLAELSLQLQQVQEQFQESEFQRAADGDAKARQIAQLILNNSRLNSELEQARSTLAEIEEKCQKMTRDWKEFMGLRRGLEERVLELEKEMREKEIVAAKRISTREEELAELKSAYETQKEYYSNFETQLQEKIAEYEGKLVYTRKKYEDEGRARVESLVDDYEARFQEVRRKFDRKSEDRETQYNEEKKALEEQLAAQTKKSRELAENNMLLQVEQAQDREVFQYKYAELRREKEESETHLAEALQQCKKVQSELDSYLRDADQINRAQLGILEKELQKEFEGKEVLRKQEMREYEQRKRVELRESLKVQATEFEEKIAQVRKELKQNTYTYEQQLRQLKERHQSIIDELTSKFNEEREKALQEIKNSHAQEVLRFQNEIKHLQDNIANNARGIIEQLKLENEKRLMRTRDMYEDKIKLIQEEAQELLQETQRELQKKLQTALKNSEDKSSELQALVQKTHELQEYANKTRENALKELKSSEEKFLFEQNQNIEEINYLRTEKLRLFFELEQTLKDNTLKIEQLTNDHKQIVQQKDSEITSLKQQLQKCETQMRDQYERKINENIEEQAKFLESLKGTEAEQVNILNKQNKLLQQKCQETIKTLEERPSRNEDLEAIRNLKQLLQSETQNVLLLENKLHEANQIIRYLQLEVQNFKATHDVFRMGSTTGGSVNLQPILLSSRRQQQSSNGGGAAALVTETEPATTNITMRQQIKQKFVVQLNSGEASARSPLEDEQLLQQTHNTLTGKPQGQLSQQRATTTLASNRYTQRRRSEQKTSSQSARKSHNSRERTEPDPIKNSFLAEVAQLNSSRISKTMASDAPRKRLLSAADNGAHLIDLYENPTTRNFFVRRQKWQEDETEIVKGAQELLQAMNVTLDDDSAGKTDHQAHYESSSVVRNSTSQGATRELIQHLQNNDLVQGDKSLPINSPSPSTAANQNKTLGFNVLRISIDRPMAAGRESESQHVQTARRQQITKPENALTRLTRENTRFNGVSYLHEEFGVLNGTMLMPQQQQNKQPLMRIEQYNQLNHDSLQFDKGKAI